MSNLYTSYHDLENRIQPVLQKGEKILWIDEPYRGKSSPFARSVSRILAVIGIILIGYFAFLALIHAYFSGWLGNIGPSDASAESPTSVWNIASVFITGVLFFAARLYFRNYVHSAPSSVYTITNRRILIMTADDLVSSFGPGEVSNPTFFTNPDLTQDLFFHEKIAKRGNFQTGDRKDKEWSGFASLSPESAAIAKKILENWLQDLGRAPERIVNDALILPFELRPHRDWTVQSLTVDANHLDNLPFSLSASLISGVPRYVTEPQIGSEWNLLILSKQVDSKAARNDAALSYLTITVECAQSRIAPGGIKKYAIRQPVNTPTLLKNAAYFFEIAGKNMLACRMSNPFSDDDPPRILINENAKQVNLNEDLTSFELVGNINIMGNGLRMRQVYSFYVYPSSPGEEPLMLHFRHTFWSEERFYKDNQNKLNEIIKTTRVVLPVTVEN